MIAVRVVLLVGVGDTVVVTDPDRPDWPGLVGIVVEVKGSNYHVREPNGAVGWWEWSEYIIDLISDQLVQTFREELALDLKIWVRMLEQHGAIPRDLIGRSLDQRKYTRGQRIGLEWVVTHDRKL